MKKLNVKRLAALGTGIALIGAAIAPMASAITLNRGDLIGPNGTPAFNVVAGADAHFSDAFWGGNIASRLAQLAYTEEAVTGTAQWANGPPENGREVTYDVSNISVELAIGGETVVTEGSEVIDNVYLNSLAQEFEIADNGDAQEFGHAQLNFLKRENYRYWYNRTRYDQRIREFIGIKADALFDTDRDVKDLVMNIQHGDFYYLIDLQHGIPVGYEKNDQNNYTIPFFGRDYTVLSADASRIRLIDTAEVRRYERNQPIEVRGAGDFEGETLTLELTSVYQIGPQQLYRAEFVLRDAAGTILATKTVEDAGDFIDDIFYVNNERAISSSVYLDTMGVDVSTGLDFVTVTVGTDSIDLRDGHKYPYDDTSYLDDILWETEIIQNTTTTRIGGTDYDPNEAIVGIKIKNSEMIWDRDNPLFAEKHSLTDQEGKGLAVFLEGEEDALGHNFARFRFDGFKEHREPTYLTIKDREIHYTDTGDNEHRIPLQIGPITSTSRSGQSIAFDKDRLETYYAKIIDDYNNLQICREAFDSDGDCGLPVEGADLDGVAVNDGIFALEDGRLPVDGTEQFVTLIGDNSKQYNYHYYFSETDRRVWLYLASQELPDPKNGYTIDLNGTYVEAEDDWVEGYLPDVPEIANGDEPGEYRIASFILTEPGAVGKGEILIDTKSGDLIPIGDTDLPEGFTSYEFNYEGQVGTIRDFFLTRYRPDIRLQKAWSDYGSKYDISEGYFEAMIPRERAYIQAVLSPGDATRDVIYEETYELTEGQTITVEGIDITLPVGGVNYDVTTDPLVCPAGGVDLATDIRVTVDPANAQRVVKAGQLLFTDADGPTKQHILIGGWRANTLVGADLVLEDGTVLGEALQERGDTVVAWDQARDNIIVAGFTKDDTAAAARQLITELEALLD